MKRKYVKSEIDGCIIFDLPQNYSYAAKQHRSITGPTSNIYSYPDMMIGMISGPFYGNTSIISNDNRCALYRLSATHLKEFIKGVKLDIVPNELVSVRSSFEVTDDNYILKRDYVVDFLNHPEPDKIVKFSTFLIFSQSQGLTYKYKHHVCHVMGERNNKELEKIRDRILYSLEVVE